MHDAASRTLGRAHAGIIMARSLIPRRWFTPRTRHVRALAHHPAHRLRLPGSGPTDRARACCPGRRAPGCRGRSDRHVRLSRSRVLQLRELRLQPVTESPRRDRRVGGGNEARRGARPTQDRRGVSRADFSPLRSRAPMGHEGYSSQRRPRAAHLRPVRTGGIWERQPADRTAARLRLSDRPAAGRAAGDGGQPAPDARARLAVPVPSRQHGAGPRIAPHRRGALGHGRPGPTGQTLGRLGRIGHSRLVVHAARA